MSNLDEASEACGAYLEQLEDLQSQLAEVVAQTPKRAFYVNREDGEDEDEDEDEDEGEED
jgi:hypothetical protein